MRKKKEMILISITAKNISAAIITFDFQPLPWGKFFFGIDAVNKVIILKWIVQ